MLLSILGLAIGCLGVGWLYRSLTLPTPTLPVVRRHPKLISPTKPPRFHARRKPDWVKKEIIHLYTSATMGCRKLAAMFNRLYAASHQVTVGRTFVHDTLRAHQAEITQVQRTFKNRIPPPMPKNRVWGLDLTGKQDSSGRVHYLLGIIDHGTRYNVCLKLVHNKSAVTILSVLKGVITHYGKPDFIRTDNEAVFHSRIFKKGLLELGIRQQFTELHKPWQNGRIERLFGTLKEKLDLIAVQDFADLEDAVKEFRYWYNHVRPHQHLYGLTPEEAWFGIDPWRTPYKRALPFSAWDGLLTGYFLVR